MFEIKQLSIFLANKPGRLLSITRLLKEANINIRGMCITDTSESGVLRLIVDHPEEGAELLKEAGISSQTSNIIVAKIEDNPGELCQLLFYLEKSDLNVEYLYGFLNKEGFAYLAMKVEDIKAAINVMDDKKIALLTEKSVYDV